MALSEEGPAVNKGNKVKDLLGRHVSGFKRLSEKLNSGDREFKVGAYNFVINKGRGVVTVAMYSGNGLSVYELEAEVTIYWRDGLGADLSLVFAEIPEEALMLEKILSVLDVSVQPVLPLASIVDGRIQPAEEDLSDEVFNPRRITKTRVLSVLPTRLKVFLEGLLGS